MAALLDETTTGGDVARGRGKARWSATRPVRAAETRVTDGWVTTDDGVEEEEIMLD